MHIRRETPDLGGELQRLTVFFNAQPARTVDSLTTTDAIHGEVLYYVHDGNPLLHTGNPILHPVKRQTIVERSNNGRKEMRFLDTELSHEDELRTPSETHGKA